MRLLNSVTRIVLLVPCLLVCISCATPFPFENLQEGMTAEAVREEFGKPEATEADLGGDGKSCWTYWHRYHDWHSENFFIKQAVLLDFEEEKLVRWETLEEIEFGLECSRPLFAKKWNTTTGRYEDDPFPQKECRPQMVITFPDPPTCTSIREFSPPDLR
jgi:hypothetical protein